MVRLTTISWKIGLAVFAMVLPFWQLSALAEDGRTEKVETPSQPNDVKTVRVILLPPANDAVFAFRPPQSAKKAPGVIWEQPTDDAAVAVLPPEPAKIEEDAAFVEPPSLPEPPQTALQLPASNAASARPRLEPAKIKKDAALVKIPSLPERPPFRPVLYNIKPVQNEQKAAAASLEQVGKPASFMAKVNSAFRPLTNLWPGNRQASETVSPTAEGNGRSGANPVSADPGPASETADVKREPASFSKALRFWER